MAALNLLFRSFRLSERNLGCQTRIGIESRAKAFGCGRDKTASIPRGEFFGFDAFCKFADSEIEEFFPGIRLAPQEFFGAGVGLAEQSSAKVFFAFHQWPQVERRPIPVFHCVGAQAIQHRLRFLAQSAQICLLGIRKPPPYSLRMAWIRDSTSARLSGERFVEVGAAVSGAQQEGCHCSAGLWALA